jgi:hypothetical protein
MAEVTAVSSNGKCCSVCNVFKPFNEFNNKKCSKDGYRSQCKDCRRYIELMSISREENRPPMIIVDGEPTICEELSLPELKTLQKQHNIVLDKHYNKKELVELLKQRGVLPASYTIGRRRVKNHIPGDDATLFVGRQATLSERKQGSCELSELRKTSPPVRLRIRNKLLRLILEGVLDE